MGSPSFSTLRRWRIEALSGQRIGPRIVASGPLLTAGPPYSWEWVVRNTAEGRRAVETLAEEGVDFIKVTQTLDRPTYFAIADEARKLDLPLAGHVPVNDNGVGYKVSGVEASNAGQKCWSMRWAFPCPSMNRIRLLYPHCSRMERGWIRLSLRTGHEHMCTNWPHKMIPRLPRIAPSLKQFWDSQLPGYPKYNAIPLQVFKWCMEQVAELHKAGIPLLAGTDLGFAYIFPSDVRKELELFVEAGLSSLDSLQTATINPAKYLNKETELGSVAPGKIADLVLLESNPLQDIRNLQKVRAVVLNGRFLDRAELDQMSPQFR